MASYKTIDFLEKVLPQAAKLPGTSGFFKKKQLSAESSAPGSEAARDKWLLIKNTNFLKKVLAQAAKLPGTNGFFKKINFLPKVLPQEAAWDKWLLQKKHTVLPKVLPQAAKLPGTSGFL